MKTKQKPISIELVVERVSGIRAETIKTVIIEKYKSESDAIKRAKIKVCVDYAGIDNTSNLSLTEAKK